MVGVALQLKEEVVGESVGRVPTVEDGHFLVLSVGEFFPLQPVVFDVVDGLQVEDGS
jgi:hypothetical protein